MTESISPETRRDDQSAYAGKNLIQVGRDYVQHIVFQFDSGNWGGAIANLGVLFLLVSGLVNGLLGGATLARNLVNPPKLIEPGKGGVCCLPANSHFEKLDTRMARLESSLTALMQANKSLQVALKARSTKKSATPTNTPETRLVQETTPPARAPRRRVRRVRVSRPSSDRIVLPPRRPPQVPRQQEPTQTTPEPTNTDRAPAPTLPDPREAGSGNFL